MGNKSKRGPKRKVDHNKDLKKVIEEKNIVRDIQNKDEFWKNNPDKKPIYMSSNKYMFYTSNDGRVMYKVCQRPLYDDVDMFLLKKKEIEQQIKEIKKYHLGHSLIEIKESFIGDDLVWYSMETCRNIRELFSSENVKYFEWNEIVPFVENITSEIEKNFITSSKRLFVRQPDYDLADKFRFEEYIDYMNGLLFGFKVELSKDFPEKLENAFPKQIYRVNKNIGVENMFLNGKLETRFLDPVYIEESLPYVYAEFDLMAENMDNQIWGKHLRWTKFIKEYFKPMIEKNKQLNKLSKETREFYKALRMVEKAYLFLLRDHQIAIDCLKYALELFADLDIKVVNLGIFDKDYKVEEQ